MAKQINLTVVVISKSSDLSNGFLKQLDFADEVIVLHNDSHKKNDKNNKLSPKVHLIHFNFTGSFAKLRNYSLSKAKGEWVLFVDTDEIVSKQLSKEILSAISSNKVSGYYIPRLDSVFHQVILHGETGSTSLLRLAKRKSGKFYRSVHEVWNIKGKTEKLLNPLIHQKDHFISEFIPRMNLYTQIDAKQLTAENKPFSYFRLFFNPKLKFLYNYIYKKGLLDGYPGLFQAYLMAVQSLSVRVVQWEQKT